MNQTKSEIKQLPFMLGKLLGGVMVVVGVTGLVLILDREVGPSSLVAGAVFHFGSSGYIALSPQFQGNVSA